ncbi:MAG: cytochrome c peroxidase [Burkholderiales bacterium]
MRHVEPRNTPTTLNAIYNFRNFWDGRADSFFNGVTPLGFRDPDVRVPTYVSGNLVPVKLAIPFSSLASQAVGPIESRMEMVFHANVAEGSGRPRPDLGKKLRNAQPLAGQFIDPNDSLLGGLQHASTRGLTGTYGVMIQQIFDQRFWGNGTNGQVCLDGSGALAGTQDGICASATYTLLEWNFSMFFGLAVQAYEATLTTPQTMVDLLVGGIATGTVTNGTKVVNVAGLTLDQCIAAVKLNNNAAALAAATGLCTKHYSQFIHKGAVTGKESALAPFGLGGVNNVGVLTQIPADASIGGCSSATQITNTTATSVPCGGKPPLVTQQAQGALLNVNRGLGRFFAGATACSACHFNPEFTGATVAAATGFGAAPPIPAPPGILRPEAAVLLERMPTFNGSAAVYDVGFYNIAVRPTPEDLSLGDQIGGVPLSFAKIAEIIQGGDATGFDKPTINKIKTDLAAGNVLQIPISPTNLAPRPFTLNLACGVGLVGGVNANNNPAPRCVPNVIPGERLLRNGVIKAQGLRNVKFTGPYFHTGTKKDLRQVLEFYKAAGRVGVPGGPGQNFATLNFNNLDAGLRLIALGIPDEAAVVELLETGLTDWRVAYEEGPFDHPELCVPHGHDGTTGKSKIVGIPAVGSAGNGPERWLPTFEEILIGTTAPHNLTETCTMLGISTAGLSDIDIPPP